MKKLFLSLGLCAGLLSGQDSAGTIQIVPDNPVPKVSRNMNLPTQNSVIPHIATGGVWKTILILVNQEPLASTKVELTFLRSNGQFFPVVLAGNVDNLNATTASSSWQLSRSTISLDTDLRYKE